MFYEDSNIPYDYKWDKFYYEINLEREKEVYYDILGLSDDSEFIFLHESKERPIKKEIPEDIMPMSIHKLGNSSVATVPTLFDLLRNNNCNGHQIHENDILVFASVGAGMNINSFVYKY